MTRRLLPPRVKPMIKGRTSNRHPGRVRNSPPWKAPGLDQEAGLKREPGMRALAISVAKSTTNWGPVRKSQRQVLGNPKSLEAVHPVKGASQASVSPIVTIRLSKFVLQPVHRASVPTPTGCSFGLS